jgi:peptide/nickel transport system permease protein
MRHELGYDRPLYIQYLEYIGYALGGDFGYSLFIKKPVTQLLVRSFPITLALAFGGLIIAAIIAVPIGILAAMNRDSLFDRAALGVAVLAQSTPNFWLAIVVLFVVGVEWGILPATGYEGPKYLILPAFALSFSMLAMFIRATRLCMAAQLDSEYVRAARARGIPLVRVVLKHALRNALVPLLTVVGVQIGYLLSGALIIEHIFNIPGMGRLLLRAVTRRDYSVIQAVALVAAIVFIVINLLLDITYGFIDPRIRKEAETA